MTDPQHLAPDQHTQLADVLASCPELHAVADHVRDFADLMNKRRGFWSTYVANTHLGLLHTDYWQ